jgi:hypothetical protein
MDASRYSDGQTMARLNQAEAGRLIAELFREPGMSLATLYKSSSKYEYERLCLQSQMGLSNLQGIGAQIL